MGEKPLYELKKNDYFRMQPNQNQGHDRYQNRQYQPYVFRPNFMKNQDGEKKQYGRKVFLYYLFNSYKC